MHRILQIPEILLNIFCRCVPSGLSEEDRKSVDSDLAALARTCRAFKEPALDILWSELNDPSPLSRCLPEVSRHVQPRRNMIARKTADTGPPRKSYYSFTRSLEQAEWDILRSYTRRVWCIRDFKTEFDWGSLIPDTDFIPADPLFPHLRSLRCEFTADMLPLFDLQFPSLVRLDLHFSSEDSFNLFEDPLMTLAKKSPNIKRLEVTCEEEPECREMVSDAIHGWSNLQALNCPRVFLDVDALAHLSRMPRLARLTFMLSDTFPDQIPPSFSPHFSSLNYLKLCAESLAPISALLSRVQLPAITDVAVVFDDCPSKQEVASFLTNIQVAGAAQTIQTLDLEQVCDRGIVRPHDAPLLEFDDLQSCMAFHNLRCIQLDLDWDVDLSDDGLITLVSAWPQLEGLFINLCWGWRTQSGITPNGLALLLQICPSLTSMALVINARGYTQFTASPFLRPISASSFEHPFHIDVLDSAVSRRSVAALAAFFTSIVPHFHFCLTSPGGRWPWSKDEDDSRWEEVHSQAKELITKRWLNVLREMTLCQS